MNDPTSSHLRSAGSECTRRRFLGAAAAAPLLAGTLNLAAVGAAQESPAAAPKRKIKLGLVGCGRRGTWLAGLFLKHGGYQFHAVADYFPEVADRAGESLGADKSHRFSGLSGYEKVFASGVEAVVLEALPGFFPTHAPAAVDAGVHVYMAKPVAVDVPGCLAIEAAGKLATQRQQVFLVDYQLPTDPMNIRVVERIHKEGVKNIAKIATTGVSGGHVDPPKTATLESRLAGQVWDSDIALGGSYIVGYDIHAIDAALWILGQRPTAAIGYARICRPDAHGDAFDVCSVLYEYPGGLVHEHSGIAIPTGAANVLDCELFGPQFSAAVTYYDGQSFFRRRGEKKVEGPITNMYTAGAVRNIAAFYEAITTGRTDNPTVRRSVDGCLTCILAREAATHGRRLTMDELLKENRRVELDLTGLKV